MGNRIYSIHGKSVTLIANAGGLGGKTGLYALPCLSPDRTEKRQNGRRFKPPRSKFYTLTTIDRHGVLVGNHIRKLTPRECERLQGWEDNYTNIPYNGKPASDTARYKALGNGMAQPCPRWIMQRLVEEVANENNS
jgi:site-specific DNA-cytosine methylase